MPYYNTEDKGSIMLEKIYFSQQNVIDYRWLCVEEIQACNA